MARPGRLAQPVAALIRAELAAGQSYQFRVVSASMAPLVAAGDAVVIRAVAPESLAPGDIVLLESAGVFVLHRLAVIRAGRGLLTQGDRNAEPDGPWPPEALIGRAVAVVRAGRELDLTAGAGAALARRVGRLARLERGGYRAARALKRALLGARPLAISAPLGRALRQPLVWLAGRLVAGARRSPREGRR